VFEQLARTPTKACEDLDSVTGEIRARAHESSGFDELVSAIEPRRWSPTVFGVVSQSDIRRRPSDILRVAGALLFLVLASVATATLTLQQKRLYNLLHDLPQWIESICDVLYKAGTVGVVVVVLLALLATRRIGVAGRVIGAGAIAAVAGVLTREIVDSASVRANAGFSHGVPEFPALVVAVATGALLVVLPFLVRPARRAVRTGLSIGCAAAVVSVVGLPLDVAAGIAIGWGAAAILHLAFGTPAATPTLSQVDNALRSVGINVSDLHLADHQVWGETRFAGSGPRGEPVAVEVLGRDAADARLIAKWSRALLYRDTNPISSTSRIQQLEHRAYLLLLAERAGVPVSEVVMAGSAGPRDDAVLVLRDVEGVPLGEVDTASIADATLDSAWANLARMREARLTHGELTAANIVVRADGTTAFVDFALGSAGGPHDLSLRDSVTLLATTAQLVGSERALAAALRSLGRAGLSELLPLLEPAALAPTARRALKDRKHLFKELREQGAALTGEEVPKLTELRRVSPGSIVMAAATFVGFYLIIQQFTGIDLWATLQDAQWEWVAVAALLAPLPQLTGAISVMGAVSAPLPYGPVAVEQFANNFTGLIGGTVANTALVIRFFQKQGLTVAVAASSGVLNSLAAGTLQVILTVVGLLVTGSSFDASALGAGSDVIRLIVIGAIVIAIAVSIGMLVPRLRRAVRGMVAPQIKSAKDNLQGILSTPRKAAMLFGGNLASQVLFALVLDCSLHAYGYSLPILQLIVINSLASVLGGLAPVPGGMGVVEAGLIGGLTAAGIPQDIAVATTFTHRLLTAYLPPVYGWFALNWLRRNDYI
jgi:uncharacterized membrane protein YbhN (UPF0104 family)/tRNA A-37 threonylcarbamoyl transferase component Bud32